MRKTIRTQRVGGRKKDEKKRKKERINEGMGARKKEGKERQIKNKRD